MTRDNGDTIPAPPLGPEPPEGEEPTHPTGLAKPDPIDDPQHLLLISRIETGLDRRFDAMEAAIISRVLGPVLEQLDELRGAVKMCHAAAARAADSRVDTATLRDQVATLCDRCQREHGPFGSLPPPVPSNGAAHGV